MLAIRQAQMDVFGARAYEAFRASLCAELREVWTLECATLDDAELAEHVARACRRAEAHGLTTCRGIASFVHLGVLYGEWFDEVLPWAARILGDRTMSADDRVELLWMAASMEAGESASSDEAP